MYNVEGGHRAVIFDRLRGVMPTPVGEGTHFLIPWLQRAIMFEREIVSGRIRDELCKRANEFNIILEDVSITHLTFGKDFTAAVEQKVIAQQEAERARFVVEKAEQEKLAGIIRAEGESQAARLVSDAYKKSGQAHLELRRIEASKEIAATLSNSKNVTYLPSSRSGSSNMLLKIE
ncbi:hypothetical protein BASA81_011688 [Batrachochytrium salamandrivorans]|nr:hypothetical protein BASA81_011688 [Batrachochytrium salamandrivorans]